jgi:hypothetical protein
LDVCDYIILNLLEVGLFVFNQNDSTFLVSSRSTMKKKRTSSSHLTSLNTKKTKICGVRNTGPALWQVQTRGGVKSLKNVIGSQPSFLIIGSPIYIILNLLEVGLFVFNQNDSTFLVSSRSTTSTHWPFYCTVQVL